MPQVVPNSQVAHLWAHQSQESARSGNGNFHFSGPVLMSYAASIARLVPAPDATDSARPEDCAALITTRRDSKIDSKTTQSHIGRARRAVSHLRAFMVPEINPRGAADHARNMAALLADYASTTALRRVTGAKAADYGGVLPDYIEKYTRAAHKQVADYVEFFKLDSALPDLDSDLAAARARWAQACADYTATGAAEKRAAERAKRAAAAARLAEKRAAEAAARNAEAIAEWRTGVRHSLPYDVATAGGGALLRVRGDKLETSQGAVVPLAEAVRVFQFVKLVRARGEAWHRNGATVRVGGFMVDHIASDGTMRAGCHLLRWAEIEAAAEAASVAALPASAAVVEESAHG